MKPQHNAEVIIFTVVALWGLLVPPILGQGVVPPILGQACFIEFDVRLVQIGRLTSINSGRLEICRNGVWGTIQAASSNSFWPQKNSLVACRQMNFGAALNSVPTNQVPFELTTSPPPQVHYSNVICIGSEANLSECSGRLISNNDHFADVHIVCLPRGSEYSVLHDISTQSGSALGDIRLVGNSENGQGIIEIYTSLGWSTVCPDSGWDRSDAIAICQNLGYESGDRENFNLNPSGAVAPRRVSDIECRISTQERVNIPFTRSQAGDCNFVTISSTSCTFRNEYAGIRCSTQTSTAGSVRLIGDFLTSSNINGIVEVLFDGRWGVVCRTTTTSSVTPSVSVDEAICGQLGHSREDTRIISVSTSSVQSEESRLKPVWRRSITCDSTSYSDCVFGLPLGYGNCRTLLAVDCGPRQSSTGLSGGAITGIIFAVFVVVFVVFPFVFVYGKAGWRKRNSYGWYNTLTTPSDWCSGCCDGSSSSTSHRARNRRSWNVPATTTSNTTSNTTTSTTTATHAPSSSYPAPTHPADNVEPEVPEPENPELIKSAPPSYAKAVQLHSPKEDDDDDLPPPYPGPSAPSVASGAVNLNPSEGSAGNFAYPPPGSNPAYPPSTGTPYPPPGSNPAYPPSTGTPYPPPGSNPAYPPPSDSTGNPPYPPPGGDAVYSAPSAPPPEPSEPPSGAADLPYPSDPGEPPYPST